MSEHWHQQLSKAAEGFGSVSVSRSYLRDALARIRELEAQQAAGEPVACRCGKCPSLGLVDVDLSDKAHPRPRVGVTEARINAVRYEIGRMYRETLTHAELAENILSALALADEAAPGVKDRCPACTYFDEFDKMPAPWDDDAAPLANGGGEVADGR